LSNIDELNKRRENALITLQELLTDARTDRPEMSNEITAIKNALTNVEDMDNYVEPFSELEVLAHSFIADAESRPPNIPNTNRLNRIRNIMTALNVYMHAFYVSTLDTNLKYGLAYWIYKCKETFDQTSFAAKFAEVNHRDQIDRGDIEIFLDYRSLNK
jgi:hypothetical protein